MTEPSPNPYHSPRSSVKDLTPIPPAPVKGLVFGMLVDFGGTFVMNMLLLISYGIQLEAGGTSTATVDSVHMLAGFQASAFYTAALVLGFLLSMAGGYVCARVARTPGPRLGLFMAALTALLGLILGYGSYSVLENTLMAVAGFAVVLFGYSWGQKVNRQQG